MAKKIKRFTAKTMLLTIGGTLVFMLLFSIVPLVTLNTQSYHQIAVQAANAFGIQENEFVIEFKDDLRNKNGRQVQGLYIGNRIINDTRVHHIQVRKQHFRVLTISTIFHEFAHAAQFHHNLCTGDLNKEQHAELLAFTAMQQNGFWWESLHMLTLHTLNAKPVEYRIPSELWAMTFGNNVNDISLNFNAS